MADVFLMLSEKEPINTQEVEKIEFKTTVDDIARWADVIATQTAACKDVFVYFKHEEEGKGPEFARLLIDRLRL